MYVIRNSGGIAGGWAEGGEGGKAAMTSSASVDFRRHLSVPGSLLLLIGVLANANAVGWFLTPTPPSLPHQLGWTTKLCFEPTAVFNSRFRTIRRAPFLFCARERGGGWHPRNQIFAVHNAAHARSTSSLFYPADRFAGKPSLLYPVRRALLLTPSVCCMLAMPCRTMSICFDPLDISARRSRVSCLRW